MSPRRQGRVDAIDAARGVALLGMMLSHLGPRALVPPNVTEAIVDGRAAPLFALLAGVSLTLVHRGDPRGAGRVSATVVRAVILVVLGLWLGSQEEMPVFVILAFYGLLILVVLPARYLPTRWLVALTAAWAIGGPLVMLWIRTVHEPLYTVQPAWETLRHPGELLDLMTWAGAYPLVTWIAYLLAGLAVGRLALETGRVATALVAGGAVLTVVPMLVAYLAIRQGWTDLEPTWRALFARDYYPDLPATRTDLWDVGPHTQMPLNLISVIGSSLLVIGLCALIRGRLPLVRDAGAMTLTLYVVHVVWTWRLYVEGDPATAYEDNAGWDVWGLQVAVLLGAAFVWRRFVWRRGPLEQVVRWLSVDGPNRVLSRTSENPRP